jgi:hypothetical protein
MDGCGPKSPDRIAQLNTVTWRGNQDLGKYLQVEALYKTSIGARKGILIECLFLYGMNLVWSDN